MINVNTIFFDIDGTIYDAKNDRIPPKTLLALKTLQNNGIKIFLASGRSLPAIINGKLDKDICWDGYVCSNGACLHDSDHQLLQGSFFTDFQLDAIFNMVKEFNMGLCVQSATEVFSPFGINDHMIEAFKFFNNPIPLYKPFENEKIAMALAFQYKGFDYRVLETIKDITTVEGKANYADVMQIGITKATGIRKIRELMGLKNGSIMSFGDADNDLEMIIDADISVAMGNGTDNIKNNADHITSAVEDEGVYKALKHFKLI
ncbi:MAG: Cof-type HAD-IIB family hydrolase [Erysipelotrichaceae bacterium]|nr:Cof-type HAD-IIB family hydrolase [Erysipelotrichaceae bacterium]